MSGSSEKPVKLTLAPEKQLTCNPALKMLKFTASNLLEAVTMKQTEEIWEEQDGQLCSVSLMRREYKYFRNKFEIH